MKSMNTTLPPSALQKKKELADRFKYSTWQIELMMKSVRLPKPLCISDSSPRRRQSDIDSWLGRLATEAQSEAVSE